MNGVQKDNDQNDESAYINVIAASKLFNELTNMLENDAPPEEIKDYIRVKLEESYIAEIKDIYNNVVLISGWIKKQFPNEIERIKEEIKQLAEKIDTPFNPRNLGIELLKKIKEEFTNSWTKEKELELINGFEKVTHYFTAIGQFTANFEYYVKRFEYAEHSLKDLADIAGKDPPTQKLFNNLKQIISAKNQEEAARAILNLALMIIVDSSPVFKMADVIFNIFHSGIWSNVFPYAIGPGDLNRWVNPNPANNPICDEEREFRLEVIAAIDHYCHGKFGGGNGKTLLRAADDRLAIELIADISSVLFSTFFGYILRRPALPSPVLPKPEWAHPFNHIRRADDHAHKMSITFSRQVTYPLKASLGLVLRGFWELNTLNNSLVEGITSLASNLVSSLLESFLYDFLWSVEIHETYTPYQEIKDPDLVWGWSTLEPIFNDSKENVQYLNFGVWVRKSIVSSAEAKLLKRLINENEVVKELLQDLLKDYGAYVQSIRDYSDNPVLPEVLTDSLEVTLTNKTLTAKCTFPNNFPSIPVLRAYVDGKSLIMKNTGSNSGKSQYTCNIEKKSADSVIYVRSNYGGTTKWLPTFAT